MEGLIEDARRIYLKAMREVEIRRVFQERVKVIDDLLIVNSETINLSSFREVCLVGLGKASLKMGREMEALLGDRLKAGILVCDRRHKVNVRSRVIIAGHPVPDEASFQAGRAILDLLQGAGPDSLIIFPISGGGSALVEYQASPHLSLEDFRELNRILVLCGASIREINIIRKRFSKIKGGGLAIAAGVARSVALYISDVNVGDISSIASSPLLVDDSTEEDFYEIIDRHSLRELIPESMSELAKAGHLEARSGSEGFRITHHLLLDNNSIVEAALTAAREDGFVADAAGGFEEGDYRAAAGELLARLLELQSRHPARRVCLISGGELSCPVKGSGFGGRNQEFVLYCAARIASFNTDSNLVVLSCGTDGIDGNSCAAGAIASSATLLEAERDGLDYSVYLKANDSHSLFKKIGGLIATGPTGNNVRDIRIMLSEPSKARIIPIKSPGENSC